MIRRTDGGWIAWFARNPVAANLLMITLLVVGGYSAINIRTEGFPEPPPGIVSVVVEVNGASSEDVEEGVVIKVEDALNGVAGIQKITSMVSGDAANLSVQGEDGYPIGTLKDDVKTRIDAISTFPAQVESVTITEELEASHVVSVQVFGHIDRDSLKKISRQVRERLLGLPDVNKVTARGVPPYEINIMLRENALRQFGLSFDEVARAIEDSSLNLSAGALKVAGGTITLQARQQRYFGQEFSGIIIRSSDQGGVVTVGDVATIRDGFEEQAFLSRFQGKPSVNLEVELIGRASITNASDNVKSAVAEMSRESWLPEAVELSVWNDEAQKIRDQLGILVKNGLIGMALVLLILALFLNIKVAFWVAIGIPVSFAGTFMLMGESFLDYSLNDLTTFGFIIVLGIVVDDAIIIGENIHSHKKRDGGGVETAIRGAREVAIPATFGVLTTVAAFYPLTTITGDFGGPFRLIAVVTIVCLLFSLLESKLILPSHLGSMKVRKPGDAEPGGIGAGWHAIRRAIDATLERFVERCYTPLLAVAVHNRYQSLGVFLACLILAGGLVSSGVVRTVFFTDWDSSIIYAELTMKPGTTAGMTHAVADRLERGLEGVIGEHQAEHNTGSKLVSSVYVSSDEDRHALIVAELVPPEQRAITGGEIMELWRSKIGRVDGVTSLEFYSDFDDDSDLEIEVFSQNHAALRSAAADLVDHIAGYDGIQDVRSDLEDFTPELTIDLKPEGRALGLTDRDVVEQLRNAVYGLEAQRVQRDGEDIPVKVRYHESGRDHVSDLSMIRIRTADGGTVPVGSVANLSRGLKQSELSRIDGKRVVRITAGIDGGRLSPGVLLEDLQSSVFPDIRARYPGVTLELAGESEAEGDATEKLLGGFLLGLLIVYALLAIPLRSYTKPFVIMLAIPFGIFGAVLGHFIVGIPMSLLSFFGVLALSGVVVNDALILTSRYNQIRHDDSAPYETAVIKAGQSRFRAVFLTSLTTFCGLIPLILETSEEAQFLIPMDVSLAFGILFAMLITLIVIPVLLGIRLDAMALIGGSESAAETPT